jgi:hypothetical protein
VDRFLETLPLWLGLAGALLFVASMSIQLWTAYR